ncbi:GATOR complex protein MIOS-B-like isoform X2 [Dendronephthya gigantea]|uniref:GATOR complex protein MIOS-B-like isoform X2 n=1 Tax=Dendronephthya gigantea TaxID=151771 RepID=UPI001069D758|nr:GATOR complex protein MIOS-B-like isoform X2 [Dendronephthya gigantea]
MYQRSSTNLSGRSGYSNFSSESRVIEAGPTYETTSVTWFPTDPMTLIAGQGGKFLKIFDVRDNPEMYFKAKSFTNTKAVYGVCVDPSLEYRVASFVEGDQGAVLVWDIRHFEKPILALPGENVVQIEWNRTRSGLLASLQKNTNVVHLHDIQYGSAAYGNTSHEAEPTSLERNTVEVDYNISGFSWHPSEENRMLIISPKGGVRDLTIFERICLSWSPKFSLSWGCGRRLIQCCTKSEIDEDISIKMYKRACESYGIDLTKTRTVGDQRVANLWTWFGRVSQIQKTIDNKYKMIKYPGVKSVICGEASQQSVCQKSKICKDTRLLATVYYSDERQIALQLCNWNFNIDPAINLKRFLNGLKSQGMYERAAAVAVFNNDIPTAINILSEGATARIDRNLPKDSFLGMVAMALSGYTVEKKSLWRDHCLQLCKKLSDPYLRALFTFLTSDDGGYEEMLKDCGLEIEDQVAFACKYLPDSKLGPFVNDLCKNMIRTGNLEGMLVTGMTEDGINLLQSYINMTGDIQTVCLLAVNSLSNKLFKESAKVDIWIQTYRDLLDRWGLWHQRAEFDIYHSTKAGGAQMKSQQVLVSCTFCSDSILAKNPVSQTVRRLRYQSPREIPTNKMKSFSCNQCGKPLPRCSQCLMHMGTTSTHSEDAKKTSNGSEGEDAVDERKLNASHMWFTWCQSCRHGGHAKHILEWFEEHAECPVNNCDCNCMSLDSIITVK